MKKLMTCAVSAALALSLLAVNVPAADSTESADTGLAQEFASPSSDNRPLTRWWVPGSSMTKEEVKHEIEAMAQAGFGGAEVVPVSVAGGDDSEGTIDWGSDAWKEITKYMLEVAADNDFTIDFTMTPAWPLALPGITDVDDPKQGAQMEADGAHLDVVAKAGNPVNITLPVSQEAEDDAKAVDGTVELVGVTVAKYTDDTHLSYDSAKALDLDDVTTAKDGKQSIIFTPEESGDWLVYAWYQHPAGNTKYGNVQLDHFSKAASNQLASYWEKNLIPYYGDDWSSVRSLFIDSLEFETQLDWTYGMQEGFEKEYGYDITPYLPAIYDDGTPWVDNGATGNYMGAPEPDVSFDKNTLQIQNDWREYLTKLYINNHVKPLEKFCKKHGVTLRYQTAYGKQLETAQTALYPDIPETETLYGSDTTDFYRLQSGAIHATDKNILSLESAAEWTESWNPIDEETGEYGSRGNGDLNAGNYQQTFQDHIWHDQRAFAAGVNQVVFHGVPYNGKTDDGYVEGIKWPGFSGFASSRWSNSWGESQPNWKYASTYLDFVTRNQYILRQGTPKVDVALYHHSYYEEIDFLHPDKIFNSSVLENNGYTYDMVSPATLDLDNMTVEDGVLDKDGSAYKALVIDEKEDLPYETAQRFLEYAKAGLPIIIIGQPATQRSFVDDKDITGVMNQLLKQKSVVRIDSIDDTAQALEKADVTPDASYDNVTLIDNHRSDDGIEYYYLYNDGGVSNFRGIADADAVKTDVTLQGSGTPYELDAWTGEIREISDYTQNDGSVTVHVELDPNESTIIALSQQPIEGAESPEKEKTYDNPTTLTNWNLKVESWTEGDTPVESKKTEIDAGTLDELKSWDQIDALKDVSGIGTYTTTFEYKPGDNKGAVLDLGKTKDAFGLKVNGKEITVNQVDPVVDITEYLVDGTNTVEVTDATSLLNALLVSSSRADEERRSRTDYGLTQPVTLTTYTVAQ